MALPYPGMDFVPFDILTAEELDKIVENVESLADGSGQDAASLSTGKVTNPYKFSVYRNTAWNTANNVPAAVPFDTKLYDTGSNVDVVTNKGRFTAPVTGFYKFSTSVLISGAATRVVYDVYKNGVAFKRLCDTGTVGGNAYQNGDAFTMQLTAGNYVEIYEYTPGIYAGGFGTAPYVTWFDGELISAT